MMGMSIAEFADITVREFTNKLSGYQKLKEQDERLSWEQLRWHAFHVIPNKKRTAKITDLVLFPWEQKKNNKMDAEIQRKQAQELAEKWQGGSKPNKILI